MYKKIKIGLFKGSTEKEEIQLSADVFGLIELQESFKSLANGMDCFNFSSLRLFDHKSPINLVAYNHPINGGLKHTGNGIYEWRQTTEKWNEFRDKLINTCYQNTEKNIRLESGAAHQEDLQVAFTYDEYDLIDQ